MRVAIFTDTFAPHVNGVARTLARLVRALDDRGHRARVFTVDDPRATSAGDVVRWPGIPFWGYPELRLASPSASAVTTRLLDWSPSLVHVATPFGIGLAGVGAARRLSLPVISSYHTSFSQYARFYGLSALAAPGWSYLRWFHNQTQRTCVPTRAIRDELESHGFKNLTMWPRGIDADVFNPRWRSEDLRRSWGADADTVVVAYVGRVAKEKGVEIAADGVAELDVRLGERARQLLFVVVGDGPSEAAMRARAPKRTRFLGRRSGDQLSAAYASADVLVFPSATDTFGNVLLEGMASGLAVLAADVPQSREVCGAATAEFFAAGSASSLSEQLERLVADGAARDRLRENALRHARALGWEAVFDNLVAEYETVIRATPSSQRADRSARRSARVSRRPVPPLRAEA
jgi:glycosyltransferase involved in cell wall biosynthesis